MTPKISKPSKSLIKFTIKKIKKGEENRRLTSFIKNIKKYHTLILFLIIFITGCILRYYNFFGFALFAGDQSKDILISKHLNHIFDSNLRPSTYGGGTLIKQSPVYYWFLALIWLLTKSPFGSMWIVTTLGAITIIFGYWVGTYLRNPKTGLGIALLVAVSFKLSYYSRTIWTPALLQSLTMISLMLLFRYVRVQPKNNLQALLLPTILGETVFFALHLHPSFFPLFFVLSSWIIALSYQKTTKKYLWLLWLFVVYGINTAITLVFMIQWKSLLGGSTHLFIGQQLSFQEILSYIWTQYTLIPTSLFTITSPWIAHLLTGVVVLALISICIWDWKQKPHVSTVLVTLFLGIFISSGYQMVSFGSIPAPIHYLFPYDIVFLVILVYIINKLWSNTFMYTVTVLVFSYFLSFGDNQFFLDFPNQFSSFENVSQTIYQDSMKEKVPMKYTIVSLVNSGNDYDFQSSSSYWYFLEIYSKKELIQFTSEAFEVDPIEKDPQILYLLCFDDRLPPDRRISQCVETFEQKYNGIVQTNSQTELIQIQNAYYAIIGYRYEVK